MNKFRFPRPGVVRYVAALLVAATLFACGGGGNGRSADTPNLGQGNCTPTAHPWLASSGDARRGAAQIAAITPAELTQSADTVLYAELLDLNCDGALDYVAQVVTSSSESSEGRLVLVAFHKMAEQWRQVLAAPSPVDGPEMIVLAADLDSDHHLDLIAWGSDEGAYVPRVFRSTADGYQAVHVPEMYTLRFEENWSAECRSRVLPALVGANNLRLSRETISPSAVEGHGPECNLPRDILALRADSLIRLSSSMPN